MPPSRRAALLAVAAMAATIALAACGENKTPFFPNAEGAGWQALAVPLGADAWLRDHALAPDRQSVYVLLSVANPNDQPTYEIWRIDQDGQPTLRHHAGPDDGANVAELFFTDRGELVWNDDQFFHFVDPETLEIVSYPQYRATAYPLRDQHKAAATTRATTWRDTEIANARLHLGVADDTPTTGPQAPPALRDEARRIHHAALDRIEQHVDEDYASLVSTFAARTHDIVGIEVELQHGDVVQQYARLEADGAMGYFDLRPHAAAYTVQWSRLRPASGVQVHDRHKGLWLDPHFVDDTGVRLTLTDQIQTGGSVWIITSPPVYDYILDVKGLDGSTQSYRTRFKDAPPHTARDHAVRLANGKIVLRYDGGLYWIGATGS